MTDFFSLFDLPRAPVISDERLKAAFFALSARWHPDARDGNAGRFQEVQQGFDILGNPVSRLRHLLAIEYPDASAKAPGHPDPAVFMEVGAAIQGAKTVLNEVESAKTPLGRAALAPKVRTASSKLASALARVADWNISLDAELMICNDDWPQVPAGRIAALASAYSFAERWESELSEWEFRLNTLELQR